MAVKSADNFRALRKKGITVRKPVDIIIATFCIEKKLPLLFLDKDSKPLVKHLDYLPSNFFCSNEAVENGMGTAGFRPFRFLIFTASSSHVFYLTFAVSAQFLIIRGLKRLS